MDPLARVSKGVQPHKNVSCHSCLGELNLPGEETFEKNWS